MGWQDSTMRRWLRAPINGWNLKEFKVCIPDDAKYLMELLLYAGYEAYVVGGCVRDSFLGEIPHDWDICTNALPEQMHEVFKNMHTIDTGLKHGTLTVVLNGVSYEVTTYRKDGDYSDHRHPDSVEFVGNLKDDLSRRDFTINAMAADIDGNVVDLFDGKQDLYKQTIRCVGKADERFQEDALRILRALRFSSRLGFVIDDKTYEAMCKNKMLLQDVSAERVAKELSDILMGDHCFMILRFCHEILSVCVPEIAPAVGFQQHNPHHIYDVWNHTASAITTAPKDLYIRLALLYHDLGKPQCFTMENGIGHFYGHAAVSKEIAEKSLRNLRFDNKTIEYVTQLVESHDRTIEPRKPVIRRCLNKFGKEQFVRLLYVKKADYEAQINTGYEDRLQMDKILEVMAEIEQQKDCFTLKDLAVNGNDLMEIGIPAGKMIGKILNQLLEMVMDGQIENAKTQLLVVAEEMRDNDGAKKSI